MLPSRADSVPRCTRRVWLGGMAACVAAPALGTDEAAGAQPVIERLAVPGGQIELQFTPDFSAAQRKRAGAWVQRSADAIALYFGRFPVPEVELLLQGGDGAGVGGGVTSAEPSLLIRVRVGRDTTQAQYRADWVLVHEMVHLALPRVPRAQRWLHEGAATYIEAVARARAGLLQPAEVWHAWMRQMPVGQPRGDDRGLDHTPTWARTYWGGAMFFLQADVRLRRRGTPERGLQQALQGVLAAGGDYRVVWDAPRILAAADAALRQTTLSEMYADMKDQPAPADLATLWRELGVSGDALRDDAPLAAVRRAILG
ncbi:MAG: hypothetical protein KIT60_28620 [Burkholderiaceae bacterium]|nr:hypothetical protein [Burkholderiaceae bacterium]